MLYSRQKRVLFVHVSRTGGTTLVNCLRRILPDAQSLSRQHEPLVSARPILGALFEESFKFAFVRNPWDRFVSWYALIACSTLGFEAGSAALIDPSSVHWKEFDAFLECWSALTFEVDGVSRPRLSQWAQLVDADGQLLTNDIGRFENFTAEVARLSVKVNIKCPQLPTLNSSCHHHYSHYYSDFGRELIELVFCEDIEQLGYRSENAHGKL